MRLAIFHVAQMMHFMLEYLPRLQMTEVGIHVPNNFSNEDIICITATMFIVNPKCRSSN